MRWGTLPPGWAVSVLAGAAVLLAVPSCTDDPQPGDRYSDRPPTRAEAEGLLRQAIEHADERDFESLCGMTIAESGCRDLLEQVGEPPEGNPVTVESRVSEARDGFVAAHVLGLCDGDRYTEIMVIRLRDTGSLEFVSPVYWSGYRVFEAKLDEEGNPTAELSAEPVPNPCN